MYRLGQCRNKVSIWTMDIFTSMSCTSGRRFGHSDAGRFYNSASSPFTFYVCKQYFLGHISYILSIYNIILSVFWDFFIPHFFVLSDHNSPIWKKSLIDSFDQLDYERLYSSRMRVNSATIGRFETNISWSPLPKPNQNPINLSSTQSQKEFQPILHSKIDKKKKLTNQKTEKWKFKTW